MINLDIQRELFVNEIKRMKEAINKTTSSKLKKDYSKAIYRMSKELKYYDRFRTEVIR